MCSLIRSTRNLIKPQFHCACYSALKQPKPEEPDETLSKPVEPPKQADNKPAVTEQKYDSKLVTKEDMKWRTPWHQREASFYSTLRTFYSEHNQNDLLKLLQTPINLTPSAIKKWWTEKKEFKEMMLQSYIPERNQTLGNELAAAHFIVHRGGAVKFYNEDWWIKANKYNEYKLPRFYQEDKVLQAIDCTDMNLFYEGLVNLKDLKQVEWLRFSGVEKFDDWYLDRISNMFRHSLVYLDIRDCPNYTERGLGALHRMEKLKILCIDDMLMTESFEMTCLLLQEVNPDLDIKIGDFE
ncbi:distal membrane-arm assembly complex protein 2 [Tribolium madens]|uniref:distal membrane-arm assembly complex protein 2 n=1 Tax=Tribolium madens TaxID=41895 RepID=UPI001CF71EA1|nr:distal membrane-arm assembly complex protein 2 [Tribolium madens]